MPSPMSARRLGAFGLSQGGRPCAHLQPSLGHLNSEGRQLSTRVADHLFDMWALSSECAACKRQLVRVVASVVASMDAGAPTKAYTTDPRRSHEDDGDAGRRTKRHRVDEDYKTAIVALAVQKGSARTPRAVIVADGKACADNVGTWDKNHMLLLQSSSWLAFSRAQHISVAGDASRLGNPAEETQVNLACNLETGVACWLPPQVCMGASNVCALRRAASNIGWGGKPWSPKTLDIPLVKSTDALIAAEGSAK